MENTLKSPKLNNTSKLVSVSIGHFFNDFYMTLIPPILFIFAAKLSLSMMQQASIAAVISFSGSFGQPLVGLLIDKKGKPFLLILSVLWISIFMSIACLVSSYSTLLIIVALGSIASAIYHPLGSAMALSLSDGSRGKNLSIFMTIGGFAASLSPIIAIPIAQKYGLDKLSLLMIPGIITAIIMYFTKVHKTELLKENRKNNISSKSNKNKPLWLAALVSISTTRNIISKVLISFGIQILLLKRLSLNTASTVLFVYLLSISIGTILGGYLSEKFSCKRVFLISNIILLLSLTSIIFLNENFTIIAFIFAALSFSASHTPNVIIAQEIIPCKSNFATGLILGLSGGLAGIFLILFGKIADGNGLINALMYLIIPLIIINIFTIILPDMRRKC
ncbi:MAG: MFS transporter [Firmicutes bacterium]|jgi:FSR family fosmidomycin resistance protein-like MFS transporter|nr:MFS transporter [Bacillota bacterium]